MQPSVATQFEIGTDAAALAVALNDYGVQLHDSRFYRTSEVAFRRAVATAPENAQSWNGLGVALLNLGELHESEQALLRAITLNPKSAAAWANLGLLLGGLHRPVESKRAFDKALELKPSDLGARWNRANVLLESGQWAAGLEDYECRIAHRGDPQYPAMPYPMWNGEDLNGKTIFIHTEQGIGDRILVSRYLVWLKRTYPDCKIIYFCKPMMVSLMWEFRHILDFLPEGVPYPKADYGLYEMSLLRFAGAWPGNIEPDPGLIRKRAEMESGSILNLHAPAMKVGICWTGSPDMSRNAERSIPFEMMTELAADPNVVLVSLQVGPGAADIRRTQAHHLVCDLSDHLDGHLNRTAATILDLDLVVTCCTSIAHLSGALGVPCWTLLAHSPYWVWLQDRSDCVWYPNTRLFRQETPGDWRGVIDNVAAALSERAHQFMRNASV